MPTNGPSLGTRHLLESIAQDKSLIAILLDELAQKNARIAELERDFDIQLSRKEEA